MVDCTSFSKSPNENKGADDELMSQTPKQRPAKPFLLRQLIITNGFCELTYAA